MCKCRDTHIPKHGYLSLHCSLHTAQLLQLCWGCFSPASAFISFFPSSGFSSFPHPLDFFPFPRALNLFFSSTSGFFFFFPSSGFLIFSHPLDFFPFPHPLDFSPFPHPLDFSPSGILIWAPHCPEARGKGCRTPWVVAFEQHPELQEILKTQAPNRHIYNIPSISN